ncbi:MAG: hypothetical protein HY007_02540 [Candidatus Sungbacteria bacterium]|nr:hypothetical protein [Candidatus Sungbacteria bacterium]
MDILGEYEKQNPQPVRAAPQRQLADEYGFFIRLVMRLSGWKIENSRQASYVLLAAPACARRLPKQSCASVKASCTLSQVSTKLLMPAALGNNRGKRHQNNGESDYREDKINNEHNL